MSEYASADDALKAFQAGEISAKEFNRICKEVFFCWYDPLARTFYSLAVLATKDYEQHRRRK